MNHSQIVNTYVKTLFSLAQEENKVEEVERDLKDLEEHLRMNSGIMKHILYPKSLKKEQKRSLSALTQNLCLLIKNFIGVLDRYHRLNLLFPIIYGYRKCVEVNFGFIPVLVESAVALEENEKIFLKNYLKEKMGKEIILSAKENPKLLGGFQVQINSILIDCSLKTKISNLEKTLKGKS
ncbi:MAG: ATP synthase F1 subunit delta [Proteobacteria bacterium]|nr:ATP synthase F1 subunit delta [Pseudomonadota bacterium]